MSPDNNNVDDLDFSDLDLDGAESEFDESFDEAPLDKIGKAPGKKSSTMFWGVCVVVVAAVVGLGLWQFGIIGAPRQPYVADNSVPPADQQVIPGTEAALAQQDGQQPGTSDPFNVMGTPDAGQQPAPDATMAEAMTPGGVAPATAADGTPVPAMTDDMPVTSVMPASEAQPQASAAEGSTLPMPVQPGNTVPQAEPVATQGPATETPAPAAATPPTVLESAPAAVAQASQAQGASPVDPVTATDLNTIMARLDSIEKRLDAQSAAPEASPAVANELQDLKAAVARLENQPVAEKTEAAPAPKPAKKKTVRKKAPAKKASTKAWDKPYDGGAVGSGMSSSSASSYSLRAAQPGVAWVSDSSGALQEVRVGDTLSGIGRVGAINQVNGRWTVSGQSGQLTQ